MSNTIRLMLYPGASPNSTPDTWEPYATDISAYVRRPGQDGGAAIAYSGGKQDESTQTDAGVMTLTLDNRDGRFSTDKIDGPWYGLLDINTPIRLGVVAYTDAFNRSVSNAWGTTNAALGQSWNVTGAASQWSVDGSKGQVIIPLANTAWVALATNGQSRDVDITTSITPNATATGAVYAAGHTVRRTDGSNTVTSILEFDTAGTVTLKVRSIVAGVTTTLATAVPTPSAAYTAGQAWMLRTQADGDDIRAKAWPASGTEPTSWMALGVDGTNLGNAIGIYTARFASNTNSGSVSLLGIDNFTATSLEWTGYVVSWPLRWDQSANNSWAPITAGGILRRLRQGTNPIQSPLRRQLAATANVTGYWPMEEGSDAKYFLGTVKGTATASFAGVTPAQDNTLAGGGSAPAISVAGGSIVASVKSANNGTGMAAMFFVKLSTVPSTKTRVARIRTSRGPVPIYDLSVSTGGTWIDALDTDGSSLGSVSNLLVEDWTQWIAWQIETDNTLSGGNTTITGIYHAVGKAIYWAQSFTVAGTTNTNVSSIQLTGDIGTAFAHIWLGRNTLPFVTDSFSLVSSGYATEAAIDRFVRVCGEAGISCSVAGTAGLASEKMGPQKEASTMAVLQSCADADYGVISERGAGLEFIPRAARWNLAQIVTASVAAGQIGDIPQPTRDDQRLRNKWTISRTNGGSSSFQDDASVARNGTWEDSATINTFDDSVLENHAAWRVAIGVQVRLRWPSVTLNFARSPELMPGWRQRSYGSRFGITSGLTQVRGNEPDLIVEGYQATLTPETWTAELNCTDARIWSAAVSDDTGIYGRVDMDDGQCTTTALISSTALSIPITTATGYTKWDNTAGLWSGGVDMNVGGERVTVTSIANGAGQAQTLTVSARGVNGYAASHPSGTEVSLWSPAPVAL